MSQTTQDRIYLDYAATTPAAPEVVEAMLPWFTERFGNPLSVHSLGQEAKRAIETARGRVASFLGASTDEIIFTGGGTESDNLALKGVVAAMADRGYHVITSAIEHHAVIETCRHLEDDGVLVTYLNVDAKGRIDPEDVRRAITDQTVLISIMHANNEIGTVQPIAQISAIAREYGIVFHTDAVQTVGHLPTQVDDLGVDLLSASAHKFYGPKGVGFLYVRKGTRIEPLLHGGEQEKRRRASTHNVPAIVGLGKAVELAARDMAAEAERITGLRNRLIDGLLERVDGASLNGDHDRRLPNNVNICFDGTAGEALVVSLDMKGICCSAGSACTSITVEPSHVLLAIGVERALAYGALRLSLGRGTTETEIERVLDILPGIVKRLRTA